MWKFSICLKKVHIYDIFYHLLHDSYMNLYFNIHQLISKRSNISTVYLYRWWYFYASSPALKKKQTIYVVGLRIQNINCYFLCIKFFDFVYACKTISFNCILYVHVYVYIMYAFFMSCVVYMYLSVNEVFNYPTQHSMLHLL